MKRTTLAAAVVAACTAAAVTAFAGPDKIAFPENYAKGVLYATVDRYDIKQYRELWSTPEAVAAVKAGRPIPSGTVLTLVQYKAKVDDKGEPVKDANGRFIKDGLLAYTVMEKRAGWGAEYPAEWRNGEWEYSAFGADKTFNAKANYKACFECHKPHEKQDFVISLAKLDGSFPSGPATAKAGPNDVNIAGFAFGPGAVKVAAGKPVTWTNTDDSPHQITVTGRNLRTAVLLKGQSASLAFDEAGTFGYICGLHPAMKGTIEVTK